MKNKEPENRHYPGILIIGREGKVSALFPYLKPILLPAPFLT
jgi:hypothetical protein